MGELGDDLKAKMGEKGDDVITHRTVSANGIKLHIAEKGTGPMVLLLHGFPELWYSWRHQISYLASRGYRAVAPDLRGFGDSDAPPLRDSYTMLHVIGDIVALIQVLGEEKVTTAPDTDIFSSYSFFFEKKKLFKIIYNIRKLMACMQIN